MKIVVAVTQANDIAPWLLQRFKNRLALAILGVLLIRPWVSNEPLSQKLVFSIVLLLCVAAYFYQRKYVTKKRIEIPLLELQDDQLKYCKIVPMVNDTMPEVSYHTISLAKIQKIELFNDLIVFEGERYFSQATYFPKKKTEEVEAFVTAVLAVNPAIVLTRPPSL